MPIRRLAHWLSDGVDGEQTATIPPGQPEVGRALLSYVVDPFLAHYDETAHLHTNKWECAEIARILSVSGYAVDVIRWDDRKWAPERDYDIFVDIHSNMERLAPLLGPRCLKVLHITGAHWLFQNGAEYRRLAALWRRRRVALSPRRQVPPSRGIEYADCATVIGNSFTAGTFAYAGKRLYAIPGSPLATYPWPERNFESCRRRLVWLGSAGMVHKGLDLVLEAVSGMPEYHLTVCGPVSQESDFDRAFARELYRTPNIRTVGWIDVRRKEFLDLAASALALVYPSCSEGQAGSVITAMHAGLIPVVSTWAGIDVDPFGVPLNSCSVEEIRATLVDLSRLPTADLYQRTRTAWDYARRHHTREAFTTAYRSAVSHMLSSR